MDLVRMLANAWLVPPAVNILTLVVGLLLTRWHRRLGLLVSLAGLFSLWLFSTLFFSSWLAASIERYPVASPETIKHNEVQVIIVLGSGHLDMADEYGVSTPTANGLVRLHYTANLHRRTGLPVMLTGGPMNQRQEVHADIMGESLQSQFGISARWFERKSATTWQNALFSAEILQPVGVTNVALVTHSYHMQRAVKLFELAGFKVTAAPTRINGVYPWRDWRFWIPRVQALDLSSGVLHEYLGLWWYSMVSPLGNSTERELRLYVPE